MKLSLTQKLNNLVNGAKRSRARVSRIKAETKRSNVEVKRSIQIPSNIQRIILIGLVGFILFSIIELLVYYSSIKTNTFKDYRISTNNWSVDRKANILFVGIDKTKSGYIFVDRVLLLHINPQERKLGIFSINTSFIARMSPKERASINLAFMTADNEAQGMEYTVQSVQNLLGLRIDKYVMADTNGFNKFITQLNLPSIPLSSEINDVDFGKLTSPVSSNIINYTNYLSTESGGHDNQIQRMNIFFREVIKSLLTPSNIFNYRNIIRSFNENVYTDLSRNEIISLLNFFRDITDNDIRIAYTREASGIKQNEAGELEPVIDNIDKDIKTILFNQKVETEQAKVEVLNATNTSGLASKYSRIIENLGCRVVKLGNTFEKIDNQNYIYTTTPEKYKETIREIRYAFDEDITIVQQEYPFTHIGDLVVLIGK